VTAKNMKSVSVSHTQFQIDCSILTLTLISYELTYQRVPDSKAEVVLVGLYSLVVCCTLAQEVLSFLFPLTLSLTATF